MMYASDHDGFIPPKEHWLSALEGDAHSYHGPGMACVDHGLLRIASNGNLVSKELAKVAPGALILVEGKTDDPDNAL